MQALYDPAFRQANLYSLLLSLLTPYAPFSETALRLPSVLCAVGAAALLYATCKRLAGGLAASYGLLLWLSFGEVGLTGANARAYSLLLLWIALAIYALVRAGREWKPGWLVLNGFAYAAAIYTSLFAAVAPALQAAYFLYLLIRGEIRWKNTLLLSPLTTGILAMPLAGYALRLQKTSGYFSYLPMPTWTDLGISWLPPRWVIAAAAAWALTIVWTLRQPRVEPAPGTDNLPVSRPLLLSFFGLLAMVPAAALFVESHRSGHSLFAPRYMLTMTVPAAMLGACAVVSVQSAIWRMGMAAALLGMALISTGRHLWTVPFEEDWRGVSAQLTEARKADPAIPIVITAVFIEGRSLPVPFSEHQRRWLGAPFLVYPVPGDVEVIPHSLTDRNETYAKERIDALTQSPRFYVVVDLRSAMAAWIHARIQSHGAFTRKVLAESPALWLYEKEDR